MSFSHIYSEKMRIIYIYIIYIYNFSPRTRFRKGLRDHVVREFSDFTVSERAKPRPKTVCAVS